MMQLAINSKNYHKKKLEEKLLIQLNNLNNTLNKNKVLELIEIAVIQENILLEILCLEYQKELEQDWIFDNYSINNICNAENNKAEYTSVKPVYIRYSRDSGEDEII